MRRAALTGGIATGKSYCLARFAALGAAVVDADQLAREAVAPGTAGLASVVARFGPTYLRADGSLDRPALGRLVFADRLARAELEAIIHPEVYRRIGEWFANLPAGTRVAIADIPLLFEKKMADRFERILLVDAPRPLRLERLVSDRGLRETEAMDMIAAQMPAELKRARADFIIDNEGTLAALERRVEEVWSTLDQEARSRESAGIP